MRDMFDLCPRALSARYFGTPRPDERTLVEWCRPIFRELFHNARNDPAIAEPGLEAAAELRAHILAVIEARARDGEPRDVPGGC